MLSDEDVQFLLTLDITCTPHQIGGDELMGRESLWRTVACQSGVLVQYYTQGFQCCASLAVDRHFKCVSLE